MSTGSPTPDGTTMGIIISAITTIVVAVVGFLSARFAARQSTKVSENTNEAANKNADTAGWRSLIETLQGEISRVRERTESLEATVTVNKGRITALEDAAHESEIKYKIAVTYIRDTILWVRTVFGTDKLPPVLPPELQDDVKLDNL